MSRATELQLLREQVSEHVEDGSYYNPRLFGAVKLPHGYAVLLNRDESHYYWLCWDGRGSSIHWDRWACLRGAKEDAACKD